jgi:hypothetical protein
MPSDRLRFATDMYTGRFTTCIARCQYRFTNGIICGDRRGDITHREGRLFVHPFTLTPVRQRATEEVAHAEAE